MKLADALRSRHSCRAFLAREVESDKIERILRLAAQAPSGGNLQPWQVTVVSGRTKQAIAEALEARFRAGIRGEPDYRYYPEHWTEPYTSRRLACGMQLYSALGIEREDKDRRREQWIENYHSFGAPIVLYLHMESHLATGAYVDLGIFLQSLMLAALEEGLATCPQQALAEYPQIVKRRLGIGDDCILLCGIALGYEDTSAPINQYRTPRAELAAFVRYFS
ncbi:nitroreductase [Candidatus Thiosymbion oneisti]|uniref:nitroreductase n=1 Tax=Candidatus Thiosymbion oneisti TaxID=589554 RepID=UPI000B7EA6D1|nr:nitroreductase [Candidatus Thiosymbion oneisti]